MSVKVPLSADERGRRAAERRRREARSRWSEAGAALSLLVKGYRILAWRWTSPAGEIDLIATRGSRLAFVEVKQRPTREDAEASITNGQSLRIRNAAELWLSRNPRYQDREIHFDAIFVLPWSWPDHVTDRV